MAREHVIDITVQVKDKVRAGVEQAKQSLKGFERTIERTQRSLQRLSSQEYKIVLEAVDRASQMVGKVKSNLSNFTNKTYSAILSARNMATTQIQSVMTSLRSFSDGRYNTTLGVVSNGASQAIASIRSAIESVARGSHNIRISASNGATRTVSGIRSSLSALVDRTWAVTITARDMVSQKVKGIKESLNNGLMMATGFGGQMLAGAGIGMAGYDAVKNAMDFEQRMSSVYATSKQFGGDQIDAIDQATGNTHAYNRKMLWDKAQEVGATTAYTSGQAAQGLEYMALAGWNSQQQADALKGLTDLASATGTDLGMASDTLTNVMSALGDDKNGHDVVKEATRYADVMAMTTSSSNTDMTQLAEALKYAAPVSGVYGYSLEDTSAVAGMMANAGVQGSMAGTSMRRGISALSGLDVDTANQISQEYGIDMSKVVEAKTLADKVMALSDATKNMDAVQKDALVENLVGVNAKSGWLAVLQQGTEKFKELKTMLDESAGSADLMAKEKLNNVAGQLTILGSAWDGLTQKVLFGTGEQGSFMDKLKNSITWVTDMISSFTKNLDKGLGVAVFDLLRDVIRGTVDEFKRFDGVGSILAGGALIAGIAKIISMTNKARSAIKEFGDSFNQIKAGNMNATDLFKRGSKDTGVTTEQMIKANTVVVNCNTATINSRNGSTGQQIDIESNKGSKVNYDHPDRPPRGASSIETPTSGGRFGKIFGGAGKAIKGAAKELGPLALALGAFDIYDTYSSNQEETSNAQERIYEAKNQYDYVMANKDKFSDDDIAMYTKDYEEAQQYQKDADRYNSNRMNETIGDVGGGLAGGIAGAAIGSAILPVAGTAIGGIVGSIGGSMLGGSMGANFNDTASSFSAGMENNVQWVSDVWGDFKNEANNTMASAGDFLEPLKNGIVDVINFIVGAFSIIGESVISNISQPLSNVWENISENVGGVFEPIFESISSIFDNGDFTDTVIEMFSGIGESVMEFLSPVNEQIEMLFMSIAEYAQPAIETFDIVWATITEGANVVYEGVTTFFAQTFDAVCSVWGEAVSFFGSIWDGISSGVDGVYSAITGAFTSAVETVKGAWSGVVDFFSGVFNKVSSMAKQIMSVGSSITGLGGNDRAQANGGFVFSPFHALVGEAGPEVIIPLGASKRNRGTDLWEKAGRMLGIERKSDTIPNLDGSINDITNGGITDAISNFVGITMPSDNKNNDEGIPFPTSSGTPYYGGNSNNNSFKIDIGGFNPSINVNSDGGGDVADQVMGVLKKNMTKIADDLAGNISTQIGAIFNNQPLSI